MIFSSLPKWQWLMLSFTIKDIFDKVNDMASDDLETQGDRAGAAIILIHFTKIDRSVARSKPTMYFQIS